MSKKFKKLYPSQISLNSRVAKYIVYVLWVKYYRVVRINILKLYSTAWIHLKYNVEQKKPDIKECILLSAIYMEFKNNLIKQYIICL